MTAKSSPELAFQFSGLAARAVGELGYAGAERWLLAAIDVYDREGLYRAGAELKDLAAFVERARESAWGASFEQVAGVLGAFVAGLAGRRLELAPADSAWTDGVTLHLPQRVTRFASRAENFRVYKVSAALLWAQTRFGSFALAPADYPSAPRELALLNLLEALRLAARFEQDLPGLYRDLEALSRPALGADFARRARAVARAGRDRGRQPGRAGRAAGFGAGAGLALPRPARPGARARGARARGSSATSRPCAPRSRAGATSAAKKGWRRRTAKVLQAGLRPSRRT